jgi:hypothetical protein
LGDGTWWLGAGDAQAPSRGCSGNSRLLEPVDVDVLRHPSGLMTSCRLREGAFDAPIDA